MALAIVWLGMPIGLQTLFTMVQSDQANLAPADGGPGRVVAHGALVLASPGAAAAGGLIDVGSGDERATLLVAVRAEDAAPLAGAVTGTSLVAVVVP